MQVILWAVLAALLRALSTGRGGIFATALRASLQGLTSSPGECWQEAPTPSGSYFQISQRQMGWRRALNVLSVVSTALDLETRDLDSDRVLLFPG